MKLIMENWRNFLLQEIPGLDSQGTSWGQHHVLSQRDDQKAYAASQMVAKANREFINKFIIDYTFARAAVYAGMMVAKEINSMMLGVLSLGQIGDIKLDPLDPGKAELVSSYQMVKDAAAATDSALKEKKYKEASLSAAGTVLMALGMFPGVGRYLQKAGKPLTDAASKRIINSKNKIITKAKDVSKKLKKSKDPELTNKAKEIDEVLVSLPPTSSVRKDIEDTRMYLDPGSKKGAASAEMGGGTTYQMAKDFEAERIAKGKQRVADWPGQGRDWYVPAKPLGKYKFIRVQQAPTRYYHGGSKGLSLNKVSTTDRPGGGGSRASVNQAGFYATIDRQAAEYFAYGGGATIPLQRYKRKKLYTIDIDKNAKVYKLPEEMQDEAGRLGLSFINFNKASQEAMAKKGIDALYNPRSGDIIIINKKILKNVKKTIPKRPVK